MPLTFVFPNSANGLEYIILDASLSEKHTGSVEVPQHPVEAGAKLADHVIKKPDALAIEGVLSDRPVGETSRGRFVVSAAKPLPAGPGRARFLYSELERLRDEGVLLEVRTGARTYENMLLTDLDDTRTKDIADAIRFTAKLQQARVVETQLVPIKRTQVTVAKTKVDTGKQAPTAATERQRRASVALRLQEALSSDDPAAAVVDSMKKIPVR